MLKDVIRRGTGVRANRELRRRDLSGKTGTTNDYRDAWFAGFNYDLTSVVWVGNDNGGPMKNVTGGSIPAEIWRDVMKPIHQNRAVRILPGLEKKKPQNRIQRFWESILGQ